MTERTSVLTVKARRSGAPALEARAVLRPAVRRLGAVALGFAGGWAVLYGALMPFGLGLVLGLAEDCFAPCAAGAALGVLLHGFGALSLRSVCLLCALGAAVAVRWVWPGRFLPAVLAGCGTLAAMGLCFALGTGGGAELALFCTADALLAAGKSPAYVCKYCLLCVADTVVRMTKAAQKEYPGLAVVCSDIIRSWVQQRLPQVYFVPGQYSSDNAIGVSILAAREAGLWLK